MMTDIPQNHAWKDLMARVEMAARSPVTTHQEPFNNTFWLLHIM